MQNNVNEEVYINLFEEMKTLYKIEVEYDNKEIKEEINKISHEDDINMFLKN